MRSMRTATLVLLMLASVSSACGGCGGIKSEDLPQALADAECKKMYECCTDQEISDMGSSLFGPINSEQDCKDVYGGLFKSFFGPALRDAIDNGRVEYDKKGAAKCVNSIDDIQCKNFNDTELSLTDGACSDFLVPLVDEGGTCKQDFECKSGSCSGDGNSEGKCFVLPGEGEACANMDEFGGDCADGLNCVDGTCEAPHAEGEQCTISADCQEGLGCDSSGTCATPKEAGEPCQVRADCASRNCADDGNGNTVCGPKKDDGAECSASAECKSGNCSFDQNFNGTCAGGGTAGATCDGR